MAKLSARFVDLWTNKDRSLDIDEYMTCNAEYKEKFESGVLWHSVIIVISIVIGLWSIAEKNGVLAAIAFIVAARSYFKSSQQMMMAEILSTQYMLAMLVNGQRKDLAKIRKTLREAEHFLNDTKE